MALPDSALTAALQTEDECMAYLEALRWPGGVACPNCGNQKISRFQVKGKSGKTRQICQCLDRDCKYQFSATTGTIFHDSHLPLSKWYEAMRLLNNPQADTSINQLRFVLGVQYKTAKNVAERIQRALEAGVIELAREQHAAAPQAAAQPPWEVNEIAAAKFPQKKVASPKAPSAKTRTPRTVPGVPAQRPTSTPPAPSTPTVVDSMLSVFTSAMNLSVKPPLAAANYLKKKILD